MTERYTEHVSTEPLEVIRANECSYHVGSSLGTHRFRRLFNEIVDLREQLDAARRITPDREAISDHDAKGLEIIAGWLDKDGLVEPAAMLRRIAGRPTAPTSDKGGA